MATVDLVVVTWNSETWLPACTRAIESLDGEVRLIGVDNGSSDRSAEILENAGFEVVRNETNRGFAAAVNQGIALGSGEWVQLVNPDAVLEPDYVNRLVETASGHDDVGSLTGLLVRGEGSDVAQTNIVDTRGIEMTKSCRHFDLDAETLARPFPAVEEVFGVSGAAGLYRRSFLEEMEVDGEIFDEDFFAYREDADLAWRGRIAGWRALSVSAARGAHVRQVTPERRRKLSAEINCHSVKNRFLLRWKNAGRFVLLTFFPQTFVRDMTVLLATLTVETRSLPAWRWLWRNRRRIVRKRRIVQSRRTVSDLELAHWFR